MFDYSNSASAKIIAFAMVMVVSLLSAGHVDAQTPRPGSLDTSFNPLDQGFDIGNKANGAVYTVFVQPDGKILIGGGFTTYDGVPRTAIARLNADGSLDASFDPGSGVNCCVHSINLQPDGKILIGGDFSSYNGVERNRIARLNSNGSLDTSFDPGIGANLIVYNVAIQLDGKILIGGNFTSYNEVNRSRIARLNTDGSLDTTFAIGNGANSSISSIALQPDGKILIGGNFTSYNGVNCSRIARLDSDGSLDTTFSPGSGFDANIESISLQSDGKILVGGFFTSYNAITRNRVARINIDGTLDTSFEPSTGANASIYAVKQQPDGKILIGGGFTSFNSVAINRIARINIDGTLDNSFNPGSGVDQFFVQNIALQTDGKILISGFFSNYDNVSRNRIARINVNGSVDDTFAQISAFGANGVVRTVAKQDDGKILIGGEFTSYNGFKRNRIARLNADGSLDTSFDPGSGVDQFFVRIIIIQPDGKILIGGGFTTYNGVPRTAIARLNTNGSIDTSFDPGNGASFSILSIVLQSDGKILIGGGFTSYNGVGRNRIARLNADGSLDTSFDPGSGVNNNVESISLQLDGKILIAGQFESYNGVARNRIARLNTNGTLDTSFDPGLGANNPIFTSTLQPDGKIVIGGQFTSYNGVVRNSIARVNADGTLDNSFNPGIGANNSVNSISLQHDGKILIGGQFESYNGVGRIRIARINTDGTLDTSLDPGNGPSWTVYSTALQSDGNILIGGFFISYDGIGRNRVARIFGGPIPSPPTFSLKNPTALSGVTGDELNLNIHLDNIAGLGVSSTNFKVSYDPTVLFLSRNLADLEGSIMDGATIIVNDQTLGEFVVSLARPLTEPITQDGFLIKLGGYFLSAGDPKIRIEARDSPNDPLLPAPSIGALFPADSYSGTVTGQPAIALSIGDVQSELGQIVNIPVTVSDLTNKGVLGFVFEINYDPTIITFESSSSTIVRTGSIIGNSGKTSVQVSANNTTGKLRIAGSTTGTEGIYFSDSGLFFTIKGTAGSTAGSTTLSMPYVAGEVGSYLNSGLPYQISNGSLTVLPVLNSVSPSLLSANPTIINTNQGTFLTSSKSSSENAWHSFATDISGNFNLIGSVKDGSSEDLDSAPGKVKILVQNLFLGSVGTITLRSWQNNREVTSTSQLTSLGASQSVATSLEVVSAPTIYGNIDGDGLLSPVDVSYLLQYIVNIRSLTSTQQNWVDVNFDGNVNSLDASFMLQKLLTPSFCFPASGDCGTPKVATSKPSLVWKLVDLNNKRFLQLEPLDVEGLISIDLHMEGLNDFDKNWIHLPDQWMIAHHFADQHLRLAMGGSNSFSGGHILRIPLGAVRGMDEILIHKFEINGLTTVAPSLPEFVEENAEEIPTEFRLDANFPNPFNPSTSVRFSLPEASNVRIRVYDALGRLVIDVPNSFYQAGRHSKMIDASKLGTGVYIYNIQAGKFQGSGKMTLVK
jgi:uncharacterized delta-60 repeat protein